MCQLKLNVCLVCLIVPFAMQRQRKKSYCTTKAMEEEYAHGLKCKGIMIVKGMCGAHLNNGPYGVMTKLNEALRSRMGLEYTRILDMMRSRVKRFGQEKREEGGGWVKRVVLEHNMVIRGWPK